MANPSEISIADHIRSQANDTKVKETERLLEELQLSNSDLGILYLLIGDKEQDFVYHQTTFLSLSEINKRRQVYLENGQSDILDLSITYHGMGHVVVLTYSLSEKAFFFRMDGGASGYDRADYWKYILNLTVKDILPETWKTTQQVFNLLELNSDQIPLSNWG
jgi:hypothetical protein